MAQSFTPGLRVKGSYLLRKIRELPVAGQILVKNGDLVKPSDVVGRAELQGDLLIIRLSEQLGLQPEEVVAGLKVSVGEIVAQGALMCEHAGLFGFLKTRFAAPLAGTIEFITEKTGHIGLRLPSRSIELHSYVGGRVVEVLPRKGVVIESHCAFIQGIFGVGGERYGKLQKIAAPGEQISAASIPPDLTGAVAFGGNGASAETLKLLAVRGAVGLVIGSLDDQALRGYLGYDLGLALTGDENVSMTVIITEGFGALSISTKVFDLLCSLEGKSASINGATQVRAGALRPEIIVSADSSVAPEKDVSDRGLQIGTKVRLIRVPYFGMEAEVVELPHEQVVIETGAPTRVLKAKLSDGKVVVVPRANVEL